MIDFLIMFTYIEIKIQTGDSNDMLNLVYLLRIIDLKYNFGIVVIKSIKNLNKLKYYSYQIIN